MKNKFKLTVAIALVLSSLTQAANAVTVTTTYINNTATEIRGLDGKYANPTVYINQRACGESGAPDARACGPYIISVGTAFCKP